MKFLNIEAPIVLLKDTFTKAFDGALMVVEEDSPVAKGTAASVSKALNYSWDGELHWMPTGMAEAFQSHAVNWLRTNKDDLPTEMGEDGLSNAVLYAKTTTGIAFIDTQLDMDSAIDRVLDDFWIQHPQFNPEDVLHLSDAHLADNLVLGRDSVENQDAILIFLYKEGLLNDSVFFRQLDQAVEQFDTEKPIVLTGVFCDTRDNIKSTLEDAGFACADKVTSADQWLWVGAKAGKAKVQDAQRLGAKVSTPMELMEMYLSLSEQKPVKAMKP